MLSSHALAIDLQPNDIVAPTPDRTAISISYVNAQNTTLYVNNVPTLGSFALVIPIPLAHYLR